MDTITQKAYAKINLTLSITGKRDDGYHLLSSVMQTIDLYDELKFTKNSGGIRISCDNPEVPLDDKNTVYKAADLLIKKYDLDYGFDIDIKKNIPVCAGLGGPSADAAACIRAVNELASLGLTNKKMCEIGSFIGADVAFLIEGGRALCEGIGDILTPEEPEELILIIAKPSVKVSTKWAYDEFDKSGGREIAPKEKYFNDFERVVIKEFPVIGEIKDELKNFGATFALMSGSGSSIFGIFEKENIRDECFYKLSKEYPEVTFFKSKSI